MGAEVGPAAMGRCSPVGNLHPTHKCSAPTLNISPGTSGNQRGAHDVGGTCSPILATVVVCYKSNGNLSSKITVFYSVHKRHLSFNGKCKRWNNEACESIKPIAAFLNVCRRAGKKAACWWLTSEQHLGLILAYFELIQHSIIYV